MKLLSPVIFSGSNCLQNFQSQYSRGLRRPYAFRLLVTDCASLHPGYACSASKEPVDRFNSMTRIVSFGCGKHSRIDLGSAFGSTAIATITLNFPSQWSMAHCRFSSSSLFPGCLSGVIGSYPSRRYVNFPSRGFSSSCHSVTTTTFDSSFLADQLQ